MDCAEPDPLTSFTRPEHFLEGCIIVQVFPFRKEVPKCTLHPFIQRIPVRTASMRNGRSPSSTFVSCLLCSYGTGSRQKEADRARGSPAILTLLPDAQTIFVNDIDVLQPGEYLLGHLSAHSAHALGKKLRCQQVGLQINHLCHGALHAPMTPSASISEDPCMY